MNKKEFVEMFKGYSKTLFNFADSYPKSTAIQNYCIEAMDAAFYSALGVNFFRNLIPHNAKEIGLAKGNVGKIKKLFAQERKMMDFPTPFKEIRFGKEQYEKFKSESIEHYPPLKKIFRQVERLIIGKRLEKVVSDFKIKILEAGTDEQGFGAEMMTKVVTETCIKEGKVPPSQFKIHKIVKKLTKEAVIEISSDLKKELTKSSKHALKDRRKYRAKFKERLLKRWKEPIDKLEVMLGSIEDMGIQYASKIQNPSTNDNRFKRTAIIKIHARALQVSNEILELIKGGFADGAYSRWRSLHELTVIGLYLASEENEVSERYLLHENYSKMKTARSALKYKKNLSKPPTKWDMRRLENSKAALSARFGSDFHKSDYGWVPKDRWPETPDGKKYKRIGFNFLEQKAKVAHLNPYYDLACRTVHGGSGGFYRLGLMDDHQDRLLLVGPTNYGLADPIQNCALSFSQITAAMFTIAAEIDQIAFAKLVIEMSREIALSAVAVQQKLEEEHVMELGN